jgi:hypothetical protein
MGIRKEKMDGPMVVLVTECPCGAQSSVPTFLEDVDSKTRLFKRSHERPGCDPVVRVEAFDRL